MKTQDNRIVAVEWRKAVEELRQVAGGRICQACGTGKMPDVF